MVLIISGLTDRRCAHFSSPCRRGRQYEAAMALHSRYACGSRGTGFMTRQLIANHGDLVCGHHHDSDLGGEVSCSTLFRPSDCAATGAEAGCDAATCEVLVLYRTTSCPCVRCSGPKLLESAASVGEGEMCLLWRSTISDSRPVTTGGLGKQQTGVFLVLKVKRWRTTLSRVLPRPVG